MLGTRSNRVMDSNETTSQTDMGDNLRGKIIDYVLVYSVDGKKDDNEDADEHQADFRQSGRPRIKKSEARKHARDVFLSNLRTSGLLYKQVRHEKNYYVLVHTPFFKLLEIAEKTKLKLPIQANDLIKDSKNSHCCSSLKRAFELPNEIGIDNSTRYFTAPYTSTLHSKFQKHFDPDVEKSLSAKDRCLLTYEVLSRTNFSVEIDELVDLSPKEASRIGIERLLANETFSAAYPLHEILWSYWANPWKIFTYQPLHHIRDYFGEKLAFYFSWLGFYTTWLFIASFVGLLVIIYGGITVAFDSPTNEICNKLGIGNLTMCPLCSAEYCKEWKLYETCFYSKFTYLIDNPMTIIFAAFMSIWSVFFIEFWQRKQSELQFEWDTEDFEKNIETVRPQFELTVKTTKLNPITGEQEPYVPWSEKIWKYALSSSAVILMIVLVLVFLFGVIVYRVILKSVLYNFAATRAFSGTIISITAATINLILIIILGRFYSWLAVKLTNLENHRTNSDYEDSLTIKMYLFQFVNYYASVFYVAFFKGRLILNKWKKIRSKEFDSFPQFAKDFNLISWSTLTLFDEYLEMVIQFGFITLFTVAFPLGPLFSLLNNIIEIRIDAFKILTQYKRPLPKKAQSIGIWLPIISAVSKLGVITNAFIIAFTSDFIPRFVYQFVYNGGSLTGYTLFTLSVRNQTEIRDDSSSDICYYRDFREPYDSPDKYQLTIDFYVVLVVRLAFVVIFEHVVFFVVAVAHYVIPNVSKEIQEQIEREKVITQKAIWEVDSELLEIFRSESALNGGNTIDEADLKRSQSRLRRRRLLSANRLRKKSLKKRTAMSSDDEDDNDLVTYPVYNNRSFNNDDDSDYRI